jgi:hypothetical protein
MTRLVTYWSLAAINAASCAVLLSEEIAAIRSISAWSCADNSDFNANRAIKKSLSVLKPLLTYRFRL